jgi:hypothetical protein
MNGRRATSGVLRKFCQRFGNSFRRLALILAEFVSAEAEAVMQERRQFSRHRTLKSGQIVVQPHASVFDCTIRNLSPKGALLVMSSLAAIPDKFDLVLRASGEQHSCRVAWRGENRLGVEFS